MPDTHSNLPRATGAHIKKRIKRTHTPSPLDLMGDETAREINQSMIADFQQMGYEVTETESGYTLRLNAGDDKDDNESDEDENEDEDSDENEDEDSDEWDEEAEDTDEEEDEDEEWDEEEDEAEYVLDDEEETAGITSPAPLSSVVLGTGINQATNRKEKVTVGDVERRGGVYILGQPRTGKTTLLVNMIVQDSTHGHGICFIDPHGDAIEEVIKQLPEDRLDDVILLDPLDELYTVGFNLFACQDPTSKKQVSRTINYVLQVFGKLFTESGDL